MKSGIYKIRNTTNNKIYIGSSTNLSVRKGKHFRDLRANRHDNSHLQNSYNKHGKKNFKFEILFTCPVSELMRIEQIFIDRYKPEYNILQKAYTSLGFKHTKETIKKLKIMRKGTRPVPLAYINSAKKTSKKVFQYTLDGNFIREWKSTKEAARKLNFIATNIACCCRKINKGNKCTYKKFKWSYYPLHNKD